MAEKSTPEQKVRGRLVRAGPAAVRLLIEMMNNDYLETAAEILVNRTQKKL